ncbi:hypothetical protein [Arsenophonus endosymbiont of Aleurodicus floccissimus]|nr:hypothetical protein [Arsenophonus endosymbiont of Aleurodicus floccissimus]
MGDSVERYPACTYPNGIKTRHQQNEKPSESEGDRFPYCMRFR